MSAKYELIAAEEGHYKISMMTALLGVARAGYYAWRKHTSPDGTHPPAPEGSRAARRAWLTGRILHHHKASKGLHGIRRIQADLAEADGVHVSLWLIGKLMRAAGIAGVQAPAKKRTTIPAVDAPERADLIRRRFSPPVPTTNLVGDITYLKTDQGWLYLATVIDLTTRMVIGWATAAHMRTELIIDALAAAHRAGYVAGGAIFHSDRGAQYTSAQFARAAALMDVRLSVGRTGECWDNAVAESFFASLKKEMYHHHRFATRRRAHLAVAEYIEVVYNRRRRHSALGNRVPGRVMEEFIARHHPPTAEAA